MRKLFKLLESIEVYLKEINGNLIFICQYLEQQKKKKS